MPLQTGLYVFIKKTLPRAVDVSVTAGLFVIVFWWLLDRVTADLDHIKEDLAKTKQGVETIEHLDSRVTKLVSDTLQVKWSEYVKGTTILYVSAEKGKELIEIGLYRDMYEVLATIATEQLWAAKNADETALRLGLSNQLWRVLGRTRDFFGMFETAGGLLRAPLDQELPLTGPDGQAKGDIIFQEIVDEVVSTLKSDLSDWEKLTKIKNLAEKRLQATKALMLRWLGVPG